MLVELLAAHEKLWKPYQRVERRVRVSLSKGLRMVLCFGCLSDCSGASTVASCNLTPAPPLRIPPDMWVEIWKSG